MSIVRTYSVFCDGGDCLQWVAETTEGTAAARRVAKRWDWARIGRLDLCPTHAAQHRAGGTL